MPLGDLIDIDKEIERLEKELTETEGEIKRCAGKLNNKGFTDKAPEAVVKAEQEKLDKYTELKQKIGDRLAALKGK